MLNYSLRYSSHSCTSCGFPTLSGAPPPETCHCQEKLGSTRSQDKIYSLKFIGFVPISVFKSISRKGYRPTVKVLPYSAKQLLKLYPGVLHLMFHRMSLFSLGVKRYFLMISHTSKQYMSSASLLSPVVVSKQHYVVLKLPFCILFYFCPYPLSPAHRCIDTNEDNIWFCTFLAMYC